MIGSLLYSGARPESKQPADFGIPSRICKRNTDTDNSWRDGKTNKKEKEVMSLLKDSNVEWRRDWGRAQHLHSNPYYGSLVCLTNLFAHARPPPGGSDYRCTKAPRRIGLGDTCATRSGSGCIILCVSCTSCGYCFAGLPVGVVLVQAEE